MRCFFFLFNTFEILEPSPLIIFLVRTQKSPTQSHLPLPHTHPEHCNSQCIASHGESHCRTHTDFSLVPSNVPGSRENSKLGLGDLKRRDAKEGWRAHNFIHRHSGTNQYNSPAYLHHLLNYENQCGV